MFTKVKDLVFGYDLCFVFAGKQHTAYVENLANLVSVSDLRCYVEQIDLRDSSHNLGNAITGSSMLIVLATAEGIYSEFLERSIEHFNKSKKKVIVIDFGFIQSSQWYYLLKQQRIVTEKASFIRDSRVSNNVVDVINQSSTFRIKNKILKQSNIISAFLLLFSIFMVMGTSYYIHSMWEELQRNRELLTESRELLLSEQQKAAAAEEMASEKQLFAAYQERISQSNELAARANNTLLSDPTQSIRLVEAAYNTLNQTTDTLPNTVLSAFYNVFYDTYANKFGYYHKKIVFDEPVNDFQHISDAKKILVACDDGSIKVVSESGQIENVFKAHFQKVNTVSYSPKNQYIFSTSEDNTAKLLTINGDVIKSLEDHGNVITAGIFTSDESRLITITDETLRIWDNAGNLINEQKEEDLFINDVKSSPVENRMAVAVGKEIRILDFNGQVLNRFRGHEDEISHLDFSINGSRIISSSYDSTAIIWHKNGDKIAQLKGHFGIVNQASFSPDRKKILTVSDDLTARLWTWDGKFIKTLAGHTRAVTMGSFSPNSAYILTASLDNTIKLWDYNGNLVKTLKSHDGLVTKVEFSDNNKSIISSSKDGTIRIWDIEGHLIKDFSIHSAGVVKSAYTNFDDQYLTLSGRNVLRLWNNEGKMIKTYFSTNSPVTDFAMNGGETFYAVIDGGISKVGLDGEIKQQYEPLGTNNLNICISAGGNKIAALTENNEIKILITGQSEPEIIKDTTFQVLDFKFNFNNELLLATDKGLYQYADGRLELKLLEKRKVSKIIPIKSSKEFLVIYGSGYLSYLDQSLQPIFNFQSQYKDITSGCYDPDLQLFYVGNRNGELKVINKSGIQLANISIHRAAINGIQLSLNKHTFLTAGQDNSAKLCPLIEGITEFIGESDIAELN